MVDRLLWEGERSDGAPIHVARHILRANRIINPHDHAFHEVFWIEAGSGDHLIQGGEEAIAPGHACFIQPEHTHGFIAGAQGLTLVNCSFPTPVAQELKHRHGDLWPWQLSPTPRLRLLSIQVLDRLATWTVDLTRPALTTLDREAFLVDLAWLVAQPEVRTHDVPAWLREALATFSTPRHLAGGSPALARLCGVTPEHLNRTLRRIRGVTATMLVQDLRLDWCAQALRLDDRPVAELATSAGFLHQGHFHQRFRARFGTSPRRWRSDAWRMVGGC